MVQFYPLKVAAVARNTRDAVVVTFDVPDDLHGTFAFRPGQYLTLRTQVDGEELRRSYSICAAPHDRELRVAIKRLNDGAFSSWANEHLAAGQTRDEGLERGTRVRAERGQRDQQGRAGDHPGNHGLGYSA